MKKNRSVLCCIGIVFIAYSFLNQVYARYAGSGLGPRVSLSVSDDFGVGAGLGFHTAFLFDLGTHGAIELNPGISLSFYSDEEVYVNNSVVTLKYEYHYIELFLNLCDVTYRFPVSKNVFVKPYAGMGLGVVIEMAKSEWVEIHNISNKVVNEYDSDWGSDTYLGLNLFTGLGFPVSSRIVPFVEIRFTLSSDFILMLTSGVTFRF